MASFYTPAPEPASKLGYYRVLSSRAGVRVSPFCLGTMGLGEKWAGISGNMNKEQGFKVLDGFYELGGNFIDTAGN